MKRFFIFTFFCLFTTIMAQQSTNRFDHDSESSYQEPTGDDSVDPIGDVASRPGNPGPTVPIDQYAGLLIFTAIGIIIYTHKKRKLLTQK